MAAVSAVEAECVSEPFNVKWAKRANECSRPEAAEGQRKGVSGCADARARMRAVWMRMRKRMQGVESICKTAGATERSKMRSKIGRCRGTANAAVRKTAKI